MRRPKFTWAGSVSLAIIAFGCAGNPPVPSEKVESVRSEPKPEPPKDTSRKVVAPVAPVEPPPVLVPDSTGTEPRPHVLVEKHNLQSVRTRLIPRVMGKGWTLSVNKSDSIEFLRNAEPALTAMLFRSPPVPSSRIRLRFRLEQQGKDGVKITSTAQLVGNAVYPYRAVSKILEDNLAELRADLLAGPSTMAPIIDRVPPKKK